MIEDSRRSRQHDEQTLSEKGDLRHQYIFTPTFDYYAQKFPRFSPSGCDPSCMQSMTSICQDEILANLCCCVWPCMRKTRLPSLASASIVLVSKSMDSHFPLLSLTGLCPFFFEYF
jgi:hypothetical protein